MFLDLLPKVLAHLSIAADESAADVLRVPISGECRHSRLALGARHFELTFGACKSSALPAGAWPS
ncbi:hypothetical protein NKI72_34625, partial [Mesorhizobium sp. M0437]|uniref:hypothetical protein n=1 Tax=Mesorhizobium sp. M0437 TaxID=2956945 RepID=UPI00333D4A47